MSIVIRTLSERVFEIVREQIVTGKLPDDVPIRQDALATELGRQQDPAARGAGAAGAGRAADQPGQSRLFRPAACRPREATRSSRCAWRSSPRRRPMPRAWRRRRIAQPRIAAFEELDSAAQRQPRRRRDAQSRLPHRAGPPRRAAADDADGRAAGDPRRALCRRASAARRARRARACRASRSCSTRGWRATRRCSSGCSPSIFRAR